MILLTTVYTVGIEIKFRTATDWLATAKGNMIIAVLGKLLPYTFIYILIGWLGNYVMFGILHIPFQGSWWLINMITVLFVIATQALGLFIFSLFPAVSLVISVVSMVGSLGATLSGVTFPVSNMYPLVRDASYLFPVRHFIRDDTNHALRRWWIHLSLAVNGDTLHLPLAGFVITTPFKTSYRKS